MSENKAFNASENIAFRSSENKARGGLRIPEAFQETFSESFELSATAQMHYYQGNLANDFFWQPTRYLTSSPIATAVFTPAFMKIMLGQDAPVMFQQASEVINADTFSAFDPVNDTPASHPGWSTDFPGKVNSLGFDWGDRFSTSGQIVADPGLAGADAFASTMQNIQDANQPCQLISEFDPTLYGAKTAGLGSIYVSDDDTYNLKGFVISSRASGQTFAQRTFLAAFLFGGSWSITTNIAIAPGTGLNINRYGVATHHQRLLNRVP